MNKRFFIGTALLILTLNILGCGKVDVPVQEQVEEPTGWFEAKTYEEKEALMLLALNSYVDTELTDCYLKKRVQDDYLNDEIAIYLNSTCDSEHQRGLYINGEYFEYEPFLEDLNYELFKTSIFELMSPRNQQYLLVFNGYNNETYGILLEGNEKDGKAGRWWVEKFHAPEGGSFKDVAGDYANHWIDSGSPYDSFWGKYEFDKYKFNNISSETSQRAQEAEMIKD